MVQSVRGNSVVTSKGGRKKESFYSESSSEDEDDKQESGSSDSKSDSSSDSESDSTQSDSEESSSDEDPDDSVDISQQNIVRLSPSLSPSSPPSHRLSRQLVIKSSSESEYSSNNSDSESSVSDSPEKKSPQNPVAVPRSNLDLLLDLDGKTLFNYEVILPTFLDVYTDVLTVSESVTTPVMTSVPGISLAPLASTPNSIDSGVQPVSAAYISTRPVELVSSISSGCNLQILYRYTRSINLYSASMVTIELTLVNTGNEDLTEIKIANKVRLILVFWIPLLFTFTFNLNFC